MEVLGIAPGQQKLANKWRFSSLQAFASCTAVQSLGEEELCIMGESFYLATVYSPDSELTADHQFPRPDQIRSDQSLSPV